MRNVSPFFTGCRLSCGWMPVRVERLDFCLLVWVDGTTVLDLGAVGRFRIASAHSAQAWKQQPRRGQSQPSRAQSMHNELLSTSRGSPKNVIVCLHVGGTGAVQVSPSPWNTGRLQEPVDNTRDLKKNIQENGISSVQEFNRVQVRPDGCRIGARTSVRKAAAALARGSIKHHIRKSGHRLAIPRQSGLRPIVVHQLEHSQPKRYHGRAWWNATATGSSRSLRGLRGRVKCVAGHDM